MRERIQRLNSIALGISLTYALLAIRFVSSRTVVSPVVDFIFVYVTSAGLYQAIVALICKLVESSPFLLRLYWGRLYVGGLWSYAYTLDGSADDKKFFGVWRFEQDLYGTRVVGFGLTDDFRVRSHVRSVSELIQNGNVYEIVNIRSDSVDSASEYYSRTTMFFEQNRNRLFRRPERMRGKTFVYGGPLTGRICNNFFVRHEDARTEQDVVDKLRANLKAYGQVHPEAPPATAPKPSVIKS